MKYIVIVGMMAALGSFFYFQKNGVVEYHREVEVVEKEVVLDATEKRIKEAQDAEMERINSEADQMRQEFVNNELKKIESSVLKDITDELEARSTQLDKETNVY